MAAPVTFHFECEGFPNDTFEVLRFTGEEGVSQLYRFEIDLVSEEDQIDDDALHDQPSQLTIADGIHERVVQGMVAEVETLDQRGGYTVYRVVLVPRVWALTLTSAHAVYLGRTTPQIIRSILEEQLGITSAEYVDRLEGNYRVWPFRMQYGDSHWDFLSRLMERDGIYFHFVPGELGERIVLCDSGTGQSRIAEPQLEYTRALGLAAGDADEARGAIVSMVSRKRRLPRRLWVQNYNDEMPSKPIRESSEVDPRGVGEVNLYGQNVLDPDEARAVAEIRAEELRCGRVAYHGEGTAFRLVAGQRFDLIGHHRDESNREYQALSVEHSGYDPERAALIGQAISADLPVYENRFTAIPADVQYRPVRNTPWPEIRGQLSAHIDAAGDGTYAEVDEQGRYHVAFPFHEGFHDGDGRRDAGKASHWLRLVQPYGGAREGMHFPLRKGARVLVEFIGGDPDHPVIAGVVPTVEQPSVVHAENLEKKTIQTAGGNRIEIDDTWQHQRVRITSPFYRSTIHVGAGSSPGDGLFEATQGTGNYFAFGGINWVQSAYGWKVDTNLWDGQRTAEARNDELGTDLITMRDHFHDDQSSFEYPWNIANTPELTFAFPNKHDPAAAQRGDRLGWEEEFMEDLLLSRVLGDKYEYLSGSQFTFHGPQREQFEFGALAHFVTTEHEHSVQAMRNVLLDNLRLAQREAKGGIDAEAPTATEYALYMALRDHYEEDDPDSWGSGDWAQSGPFNDSKVEAEILGASEDGDKTSFSPYAVRAQLGLAGAPLTVYRARALWTACLQVSSAEDQEDIDGWAGWMAKEIDDDESRAVYLRTAIKEKMDRKPDGDVDEVIDEYAEKVEDNGRDPDPRKWDENDHGDNYPYMIAIHDAIARIAQTPFGPLSDRMVNLRDSMDKVKKYRDELACEDTKRKEYEDVRARYRAIDPQLWHEYKSLSRAFNSDDPDSWDSEFGSGISTLAEEVESKADDLGWQDGGEYDPSKEHFWLDFVEWDASNDEFTAKPHVKTGTYNEIKKILDDFETAREELIASVDPGQIDNKWLKGRLNLAQSPMFSIHVGSKYSETHEDASSIGADDDLDSEDAESEGFAFITKEFGNAYSFKCGDQKSVTRGNEKTEKQIEDMELVYKYPDSIGAPVYIEKGTYKGGGWNGMKLSYLPQTNWEFNFFPRLNATINAVGVQNITVNAGGVQNITVNAGLSTQNNVNLLGVAKLNISAGFVKEFNLTKGHVTEFHNQPSKLDMDVSKLKLETRQLSALVHHVAMDLHDTKTELSNTVNEIADVKMKVHRAGMQLRLASSRIESTRSVRLEQAGQHLIL